MPWLDPSPSPESDAQDPQPIHAAQSAPTPQDPDAVDLPPGVVLPEEKTYRLNQIKAQVVSFAAMTLFALLWALFVIPHQPQVGITCVAIMGAGVLLALVRLHFARKSLAASSKP